MKIWIYISVLVMSSLVASQNCPSEHFSAIFTATIDQILDVADATMDIMDPELTFFKTYLKFRDSDIQHTTDDAIRFFNNRYGLDFSDSSPNEKNERFFQNATMSPFIILPGTINNIVTDNRWVQTGNTYSTCYPIFQGGFQVTFSADQTLYGSYGGAEGKPAVTADHMNYGFYIIDVCKQSPLIFQYQNSRPVRTELNGITVFTADLYNQVLGYGTAYGVFEFIPFPDESRKLRFITRSIFTF